MLFVFATIETVSIVHSWYGVWRRWNAWSL